MINTNADDGIFPSSALVGHTNNDNKKLKDLK